MNIESKRLRSERDEVIAHHNDLTRAGLERPPYIFRSRFARLTHPDCALPFTKVFVSRYETTRQNAWRNPASQYVIPVFQRNYRWEMQQWEKFWRILRHAKSHVTKERYIKAFDPPSVATSLRQF